MVKIFLGFDIAFDVSHSCPLQTCNRKLAHLVLQLVGFRLFSV